MSREKIRMTCEDYRKELSADPGFEDESGHLDACVECREYSAQMLALDEDIAKALQIEVPELMLPELPDVDVGTMTVLPVRRTSSRPVWFAVAATVLIAAFVGIRIFAPTVEYGSLEEQLLAHVDHEASALLPTTTPVSDRQLARAVPGNIATMNHDVGLITYAQSCSINGNDVPHLVIQGVHGPITILLMPEESVAEASTIEGVNVQGIILPVGDGSIAIIGDREEQLEDLKKKVLDSVMWST